MKLMKRKCLLLTVLAFLIAPYAAGELKTVVSIAPLEEFVTDLSGGHADVTVLIPSGRSPETYTLTPRQMDALGAADVYFYVGLPFERQLHDRVQERFPELRIVSLQEGIELNEGGHSHGHHHEEGHNHDHEEEHDDFDPHYWLDPVRASTFSGTIAKTLSTMMPAHAAEIEAALLSKQETLEQTRARLVEMLRPHAGGRMYVYHPAYGYFAERFGLEQVAVEQDGHAPAARGLEQIVAEMKAEGVHVLFVQPQIAPEAAKTVAGMAGAEVVTLDPLAPDYIDNLLAMGRAIAAGLER